MMVRRNRVMMRKRVMMVWRKRVMMVCRKRVVMMRKKLKMRRERVSDDEEEEANDYVLWGLEAPAGKGGSKKK